jgi:hypothetical protein
MVFLRAAPQREKVMDTEIRWLARLRRETCLQCDPSAIDMPTDSVGGTAARARQNA